MRSNRATTRLTTPIASNNYSPQPSMSNHQLVILSQLLQIIGQVRHIDGLFLWLVHTLSRHLGIDVIQFWTLQNHVGGQATLELRTMVSRNLELPQYVVINPDVVGAIRHILKQRSGLMPLPVASVFSQSQANLLARHNLRYWTCYFLCNSSLLPPVPSTQADSQKIYTPLVMVASLFMQQPPVPRLLPTIGHILEQTVLIAKKHRLLLTNGQLLLPPPTVQGNSQQTRNGSQVLFYKQS